jgi:gamma-glutamyltranspeptidase / glutathione hydrolase
MRRHNIDIDAMNPPPEIKVGAEWSEGYLLAAGREAHTGTLAAGCDPRGAKSEVFPAFALCW